MIEAEFQKKYFWNVICLLCGLFLIGLFVFLWYQDPQATLGDALFGVILGSIFSIGSVISLFFNSGAYLRIENGRIRGKYHWFRKLDCGIDDVEFVLPQINTLTILQKNGKRHIIMGVANSWTLGAEIRKQCFRVEKESPDSLRQKLSLAQAARRKELKWVLGGTVLLFVNIFAAVLLTGGRDLHEFSQPDWILFFMMGAIELLTMIGLFCLAQRCGKKVLSIAQLQYRLRGAIIVTHPLPTNHVIAVYTDEGYRGRIVVCGFPNNDSVYYCIQEIYGNFGLKTIHTSEIYESREELPEEEFQELIDMTAHF